MEVEAAGGAFGAGAPAAFGSALVAGFAAGGGVFAVVVVAGFAVGAGSAFTCSADFAPDAAIASAWL